MIVVTGATGTIGRELVRLLSRQDVAVRAITRDSERGEELPGVEWVEADLADWEGLPESFRGGDRLFLLTGNTEDMVRLQKNAVDAAVEAGVERVVKLSALGATDHSKSVIGLWHHNVERFVRHSGLEWTVLRPHHFMQNVLDPKVFDREHGTVRSASGDGRIPFVDTRDVAGVARAVLLDEGHGAETYTITGPEAISYGEATEILSDVLGRSLTFVSETMDEAWRRRRAAGDPVWLVAAQLAIAGYQRAGGPTERVTDTVERVTGSLAGSFEQFARDYRDELRS